MGENSEHSLLSPSGAHRWSRCPGSVARCKDIPGKTSEYAEEGTLAHAYAASLLTGGPEIQVNEDMLAPVQTYVDTVRAMSEGAVETWVEEILDLSEVVGIAGEKGTGDFIALMPGGELQVHDLKYGKGVEVEAEGNEQLIIYGLGAVEVAELVDDVKTVRLVIHQPRLNSVSEHVYTIGEMAAFRSYLQECAGVAFRMYSGEEHEIVLTPGDKQCRFCPAKGECKTLAEYCQNTVLGEFEDLTESVKAVPQRTETELAEVYGSLDLISQWIAAVKERAMGLALSGAILPGFKLVEGRGGPRKWDDVKEAEEMMKSMRLKKDEMYDLQIISPTSAEKLLKKASVRKWNRLAPLITRAPPAPALVPESDKRPAMVLQNTAEDFEDLTGEDLTGEDLI